MLNRKGQSILEYSLIVIIILGVVISMKDYVKRGVQGRWKSATDNFGDQYDPTNVNSSITYASQVNSQSVVTVVQGTDGTASQPTVGQWTNRVDLSNSVETKAGYTQIGN